MIRTRAIALVAAKAALGASLALGFAHPAHAQEGWRSGEDVYALEVGDDNADGVIEEDESGWDCTTMGNLICGTEGIK